jgi:hypothetical protein
MGDVGGLPAALYVATVHRDRTIGLAGIWMRKEVREEDKVVEWTRADIHGSSRKNTIG